MLPALAFVTLDKVITSFNALLESNYYRENKDLLEPFIDYFENTRLGKLDRREKRKPPVIEHKIWNCFSRI